MTIAGLAADAYEVVRIDGFDNLNDCYLAAAAAIDRAHARWPDASVLVDYTGGTKSMTAGLAAAALDDGRCEIQVVTGVRADLNKVKDKTEFVRPVLVWDVQVRRRLQLVREFLRHFDYAAATRALEETARRYSSPETEATLNRWITLSRAFDAWDRFDHSEARELLQAVPDGFVAYKTFLGVLTQQTGHGFEPVEDLLRNAERRSAQGRYDDATGRLYRAIEMTAQIWLNQKYGVDTGDVDLSRVPESQRSSLERHRNDKGRVKIGLLAAWDLVAAYPDDPLQPLVESSRDRLLNFLSVRNNSLFAHGTHPISAHDYKRHAPFVSGFLKQAIELAIRATGKRRVAELPQLPTDFESPAGSST